MKKSTLKTLLIVGVSLTVLISVYWIALAVRAKGFFEVKLPVLSYVQDFQFTDQNGDQISDKTVDGKIYVVNYFYTTCTGICPKMNANMTKVYDKFKNDKDFVIISHTSMPDVDSVPLLKSYEGRMIGDNPDTPAKWYFVTGSKDSLYRMARQSYMIDDPENNTENVDESFIHTQFFALVDKEKRVRGVYDGLKMKEVTELEDDIQKLMAEN